MRRDLSAPEGRVLGCLLEKQRTTPEQYPLTLNALRLACNQSTNRDPVTDYDEGTVREAAQSLGRRRLARFTSGHGGRVAKYRHLLKEEPGLSDDELAVLCVMLLRGPQTPGELKARTERLHPFEGLAAVEATIDRLVDHVEHALEVMGIDHVALGGDFIRQIVEAGIVEPSPPDTLLPPGTTLGEELDGLAGPEEYGNLVRALRDRGVGGDDLEAILWRNLVRVIRSALP